MNYYRNIFWYTLLIVVSMTVACSTVDHFIPDVCKCPNHSPAGTSATAYDTEYIVLVVIDGVRYSESGGDTSLQYHPNIYGKIARSGVYNPNFFNTGETKTISGHTAILTGKEQLIDNDGLELPLCPSFLQLWLQHTQAPPDQAWIISSKPKLDVLANTNHTNWRSSYTPSIDAGDNQLVRSDSATCRKTMEIMALHHPKIVVVLFAAPDIMGHSNNWINYVDAIGEADKYTDYIWKFIQADSQYKNKTTLIVTNDHGRHLDSVSTGFASHGDGCVGCRHINLVAIGPDFKSRFRSDQPGALYDIPATIAELLGFKMLHCDGKPMKEIFK